MYHPESIYAVALAVSVVWPGIAVGVETMFCKQMAFEKSYSYSWE